MITEFLLSLLEPVPALCAGLALGLALKNKRELDKRF